MCYCDGLASTYSQSNHCFFTYVAYGRHFYNFITEALQCYTVFVAVHERIWSQATNRTQVCKTAGFDDTSNVIHVLNHITLSKFIISTGAKLILLAQLALMNFTLRQPDAN